MNIRPAVTADAGAIAALVREYETTLVAQPESAAPFWASMSEQAHARNLASTRFVYLVAEVDGEMVGFIALRDGSHLFNLFVRRSHLRRGIARALWRHALRHVRQPSTASGFTVNASLNAVVVYRALGFKEVQVRGSPAWHRVRPHAVLVGAECGLTRCTRRPCNGVGRIGAGWSSSPPQRMPLRAPQFQRASVVQPSASAHAEEEASWRT